MKHKKLLTNLLFAAVVLAIAAVLLLVRSAHSSGSKLRAELIYGDNNTTMNLPLDKNDTYDVDTGYYTVHIDWRTVPRPLVDSPARPSVRASAEAVQRRPDRHLPARPRGADHQSRLD